MNLSDRVTRRSGVAGTSLSILLSFAFFLPSTAWGVVAGATLTVLFPGMSSVHTEARLSDGLAGEATGKKVASANWKTDQAVLNFDPGTYDLRIRKGSATLILDDVNCSSSSCTVDDITAVLILNFPGQSAVHTDVIPADGATGLGDLEKVTSANWKNDQAVLTVFRQIYDLSIRKGAATFVVDDVDCTSGLCAVDGLSAELTLDFPGQSGVHTDVLVVDGIAGVAGDAEVTHANWKNDRAKIAVFPQIFDLRIRKGGAAHIVDGVDCRSGNCFVGNLSTILTVNFPGQKSVHTEVLVSDGVAGSAAGEKVTHANWKNDQAVIPVLPQVYDLAIRSGASTRVIDDVDCTAAICTVGGLSTELTVTFPGQSGVHIYVVLSDGVAGKADGKQVAKATWKKEQAVLNVLSGVYDLKIQKGAATHIVDNVDCTGTTCMVDGLSTTLTVNFPGMSGVHTEVKVPDGIDGVAGGEKVTHANWKNEQAVITVFPGIYDLSIRKGAATYIVDSVDCTGATCTVEGLNATLTINFPGMSGVHTEVKVPDGADGVAGGEKVTYANWKNEQAVVTVFPVIYDLSIRKGAATHVVDNVDCTQGLCSVDGVAADLTVVFPGLSGVHSRVLVPDGNDGAAGGAEVTKANWKKQKAHIKVFPQKYDLEVKHAATSIYDDVDCTSGSCEVVISGNVQVTLMDGDNNTPLGGVSLSAYEKQPDGKLRKTQGAVTSDEGKVHYTLEGVDTKPYVLKTHNPFGNKKSYYSPLITHEGPFEFVITRDGDYPLDTNPPTAVITTPSDGGTVSLDGFRSTGTASDNNAVQQVMLRVTDPDKGQSDIPAELAADGQWSADVPATALTLDRDVVVTVTAVDRALNEASASVTVRVIDDIEGPVISIISHQDNDPVPVTGFLLSGTVTDESGVASLKASLETPSMGAVFSDYELEVAAASGSWTLAVQNGEMALGGTATVTLDALDAQGNASRTAITVRVVAVDNSAIHMVNRITFGATPALLDEVEAGGALAYLERQLNPGSVDVSAFQGRLDGINPGSKSGLQQYVLMHMIDSPRQLQEVMTWFWDNHFNTDINTSRMEAGGNELSITPAYELAENNAFRTNALGNFRDLLGISAKSPAMLIYLDSISNVYQDSNENYAREVMELHTVGVDGGYSDADVAAAAELFTGWTVSGNQFSFNSGRHNFDTQTVMGYGIASGGEEQGDALLDILAVHPKTAEFICTKLVTLFVSDVPPTSLVNRCAVTFRSNAGAGDQIAQVLRTILISPEFSVEYRSKIKTPVELVVGAVRNLGGGSDGTDLAGPLSAMGLRLFENSIPTGWSETGDDWITASLLIERIKWTNAMVRRTPGGGSWVDPLTFFPAQGHETSEGIANYLLRLTLGDDFGDLELAQALDLLNESEEFNLGAPDADERLRRLLGTVLSFPQYQFQ